MLENRVVRYIVYGTTSVVLSEVLYRIYKYIREKFEQPEKLPELTEVIWTNELTQTCVGRHSFSSSDAASACGGNSRASSPEIEGKMRPDYIARLPAPLATPTCPNRYCAANNIGRLIALIDQTKYTLDLAMYQFTSYDLAQAFIRALRRGVMIRLICDKEMAYSSGSQIIKLTKEGIPVHCPGSTMIMHNKFCILDGPQSASTVLAKVGKAYDRKRVQGIIFSGSMNWTMQGFGGNWENIIITSNKKLVTQFENEFQRMWKAFKIDFKQN